MSDDHFVPLKLKPRHEEQSGLGPAQLMIRDFESRSPPPVMQSALESRPMIGCRASIPDPQGKIGDLSMGLPTERFLFESLPAGQMAFQASQARALEGREMALQADSPLSAHAGICALSKRSLRKSRRSAPRTRSDPLSVRGPIWT